MNRSLVIGSLLFTLALPMTAHAIGVDPAEATPVQREQAQTRFVKGKQKYDAGDYANALVEFQGSIDIVQSPNARLYVARCLRELKRLVDAYVEFGRTMVEAKEHAAADGRYAKAAEAAQAERAAIAPYLGFVTVNVQNSTDDTRLYVANNEIKRGGWTEPVPVMPGTQEVRVESPGHEPVRQSITLQQGEKKDLAIDAGSAATVNQPPPPPPPSTESSGSLRKTLIPAAIVAGGVGVVGFVLFGVAGGMSLGTYSDLEKKCGKNTPCPPAQKGEIDRGRTEQAIANTGLVIGIVGLIAGGALLGIGLLQKPSEAKVGLLVGPDGFALNGRF